MRNRNAVKRVAQNFAAAIAVTILTGCGQNPGGSYTPAEPIQPAMADTPGSSLDLTIPLDNAVAASNPQRFAVRGKYIAIDPGSTGQANLRLNSISDTPRLAYPGSTFNPGNFTDLYFDYQAQPGKFLHVIYGDSPDILSAGVKSISDPPLATNFFSNTIILGNAINIILPAANVNGIKILAGTFVADLNSNAAQKNAYAWITTIAVPSIPLIAMPLASNPQFDVVDSRVIPQITLPPGVGLQFSYFGSPGSAGQAWLTLDYQLL